MSDIKQIGHWINGGEVAGTGREQDVFNPATGEVSARVALASVSDLEQAVDAARAALPAWRATGLTKRAAVMFKLREIVTAKSDELARIITAEHGKVVSDAAGEVVRGLLDRMRHLPPEALAGDGDVGGLLGIHLHEEMKLANAVVSIDGLELKEFDYIDIGTMLETTGAVPVVIKSLIFPGSATAVPAR